MSNIRLSSITVDATSNLSIRNGTVSVLSTRPSTSLTGALILNGGITIASSQDSFSVSSGGGLTSLGGLAILKRSVFGDSISLDSPSGTLSIGGITRNRLFIDSVTNRSITFAPDGQTNSFQIGDSSIQILPQTTSMSSSVGSLIVEGGIGIRSSANSLSKTAGGALTVNGGVAIARDLYVGGKFYTDDSTIGNLVSTNISSGIFVGSTLNISGAFHTLGSVFINNGSFGIGTSNPTEKFTVDITDTSSSSQLGIYNRSVAGGKAGITLRSGTNGNLIAETNSSGVAIWRNEGLGGVEYYNKSATNGYTFYGTSSDRNLLTISASGRINISSTEDASGIGTGGSLTVNGGLAISKRLFVGTSVSSGNVFSNSVTTGDIRVTTSLFASGTTNTLGSLFTTGGNIGIGTSNPNATLHVLGNSIISSTTEASGLGTGGSLTVGGGASIGKNIYVGGLISGDRVIIGTSEITTETNRLVLDNLQVAVNSSSFSIANGDVTGGVYNVGMGLYTLGKEGSLNSEWLSFENSGTSGYAILSRSSGTGLLRNLELGNTMTIFRTGGVTLTGPLSVSGTGSLGGLIVTDTSTFGNSIIVNGTISSGSLVSTNLTVGSVRVTGDLIVSGNQTITGTQSTGTIFVNGDASISSTRDVSGLAIGESALQVSGGVGISKGLLVGGIGQFNSSISFVSTANATAIRIFDRTNPLTQRWAIDRSLSNNALEIRNPTNIVWSIGSTGNVFMSSACSMGNTLAVNGATTLRSTLSVLSTSTLSGICTISNTTESTDSSTGALLVAGGVGIRKNLSVEGDTLISGNLTVNGTTTTINSQNSVLKDNLIILNSGPSGSRDSGFIINRYQVANDSSSGDVVADSPAETYTLGIQSGATSAQVILPSGASSTSNFYNGWWIRVGNGFSSGQVRRIISYTGSTRIAQLESPFTTQNPSNGDIIYLYSKPYIGVLYDETLDLFRFTGLISDSSSASTGLVGIESKSIKGESLEVSSASITSTTNSTNIGNGAIVISGGVGINKSVFIGDELTVNGVNITPNYGDLIKVQSFSGSQNVTNATIGGLIFNTTYTNAFDIYLSIHVTATTSRYANYHIRGIWKGGTTFEIASSYVGDDTGISFGITSNGQLTYTAPSWSGFTSLNMRFRAITT